MTKTTALWLIGIIRSITCAWPDCHDVAEYLDEDDVPLCARHIEC
jgi:hypothetical protein